MPSESKRPWAVALPAQRSMVERAWSTLSRGGEVPYETNRDTVDRLAIITYNRPESLAATLDAYCANLERYGRTHVAVTVFDDSTGAAALANRKAVAAARARGFDVSIVGVDEKRDLIAIAGYALKRTPLANDPRRSEVTSALLGSFKDDRWRGSAGEQRNWAALMFPGQRVLTVDDDTKPATLCPSFADNRKRAHALADQLMRGTLERVSGSVVAMFADASTSPLTQRPIDIIANAECQDPSRATSATMMGDSDLAASSVVHDFVINTDRESFDIVEKRLRRDTLKSDTCFRGSVFVTGNHPSAMAFSTLPGRNEDFQMATAVAATQGSNPETPDTATFVHYHERGPRTCDPVMAWRQEVEGSCVDFVTQRVLKAYNKTHDKFDTQTFVKFALADYSRHVPEVWENTFGRAVDRAKLDVELIDKQLRDPSLGPTRRTMLLDLRERIDSEIGTERATLFKATSRDMSRAIETQIHGFRYFEVLQSFSGVLCETRRPGA